MPWVSGVVPPTPIDGIGDGFASVGGLKEIDIGPGGEPRLTYVSAKLDPEYMPELIDLIKEI